MSHAPQGEEGLISGIAMTVRNTGAAIGVAVFSMLFILAAGTASAPARSLPGNLTNTIPPALIGIVGLLMLSKLLRVELSGWNKIFKDWAK